MTTPAQTAAEDNIEFPAQPTRGVRRISRQVAADVIAIGDALAVMIGGLLPALIYAFFGTFQFNQLLMFQATILASFITYICLRLRGMYDTSRMGRFPESPVELLIAVSCGLLGVLGIGIPLVLGKMHLFVWYIAWLSTSFTLILFNRMICSAIFAHFADEGRFDERIAVFGAGPIARRVHDCLSEPGLGIHFVGVYDDRAGQDRLNPEGLTVSGRLGDLVTACRQGAIDRVVIALPQSANARLADIADKFALLPVSTHVVTHIASDMLEVDTAVGVSTIGPIGLLDVKKKH